MELRAFDVIDYADVFVASPKTTGCIGLFKSSVRYAPMKFKDKLGCQRVFVQIP